jgi:hypothetical protein
MVTNMGPNPRPLHSEALENLRFIRSTMESARPFTAVPGWGQVAMGVSAIGAAALADRQPDFSRWLLVWVAEAVLAVGLGALALIRKARRANTPIASGPGRRFGLALLPPLLVGAVMTVLLWRTGPREVLPALWLLCYGAGIATGGAFSVRAVPLEGVSFMALGLAAALTPPGWGDLWMAGGFGILQIAFGIYIARRHGG